MSEYVSAEIRRLVRERADRRCEYCLLHEDDAFLPHSWDDHLQVQKDGSVTAKSAIGRVTISLLKLNRPELLAIRKLLQKSTRKPR